MFTIDTTVQLYDAWDDSFPQRMHDAFCINSITGLYIEQDQISVHKLRNCYTLNKNIYLFISYQFYNIFYIQQDQISVHKLRNCYTLNNKIYLFMSYHLYHIFYIQPHIICEPVTILKSGSVSQNKGIIKNN